jgi:hypothetical protein
MTCGCKATISSDDPRAEIWLHVFGERSFPLKHPLPVNMGRVVGIGYEGDATCLTETQRQRLIEKMTKKFNITPKDVTKVLDSGVIPIKAENVTVSWCHKHSMGVL